jgi:hypothetical protein
MKKIEREWNWKRILDLQIISNKKNLKKYGPNLKGCFEILKGQTWKLRRGEKKKGVVDAKLDRIWPYTSSHHEKDNEMIKKPPRKVASGHQTTPNAPSKGLGAAHILTYVLTTFFLNNIYFYQITKSPINQHDNNRKYLCENTKIPLNISQIKILF